MKRDELARRRLAVRGEPLLLSDWERALFLHFEVDPGALQTAVPFKLDLREGKAYVSLVAFTMRRMRPRRGGRLTEWCFKPIAAHELLNLRTYVRHRGEAAIYFLAEWIPNRLSAFLGPRTFGLPYRLGRLNYDHCHEEGRLRGRVENVARADHIGCGSDKIEYAADLLPQQKPESSEPSRPEANVPPLPGVQNFITYVTKFRTCEAGSLDEFLLERYTAFTQQRSKARFFRVWHAPWPQAAARVTLLDDSLLRRTASWLQGARLVGANYSPGVQDVWMGRPHKVEARAARNSTLSAFYEMP